MAIETIACPELNSEDTGGRGRREVFVHFDYDDNATTPKTLAIMCPEYENGNCLKRKNRELLKKDAGYGLGEGFPCIYSQWDSFPSK